jgi:hypothetical protein
MYLGIYLGSYLGTVFILTNLPNSSSQQTLQVVKK